MPPALQRENGLLQLELKLEREEVARLKAEVTSLAANGAGHQVAIERLEAAARATPPRVALLRASPARARARVHSAKLRPRFPLPRAAVGGGAAHPGGLGSETKRPSGNLDGELRPARGVCTRRRRRRRSGARRNPLPCSPPFAALCVATRVTQNPVVLHLP